MEGSLTALYSRIPRMSLFHIPHPKTFNGQLLNHFMISWVCITKLWVEQIPADSDTRWLCRRGHWQNHV